MDGIRPQFGALFGPKKSIRAGENLFAWHSALLRLSPVRFVRQAVCSKSGDVEHETEGLEFESPLLGGQSAKASLS